MFNSRLHLDHIQLILFVFKYLIFLEIFRKGLEHFYMNIQVLKIIIILITN